MDIIKKEACIREGCGMYIRQLSIFLENVPGSLIRPTQLLADAGIDLIAMSIADAAEYGILRCIVAKPDKAAAILREAGYIVRQTNVLGVCVPDCPGGLCEILKVLAAAGISVEYLYSFVRRREGVALLIFHLSDIQKGAEILRTNGVELLDESQLGEM